MQKYEKRLKDGKYFNQFYQSSFIFTIIIFRIRCCKDNILNRYLQVTISEFSNFLKSYREIKKKSKIFLINTNKCLNFAEDIN